MRAQFTVVRARLSREGLEAMLGLAVVERVRTPPYVLVGEHKVRPVTSLTEKGQATARERVIGDAPGSADLKDQPWINTFNDADLGRDGNGLPDLPLPRRFLDQLATYSDAPDEEGALTPGRSFFNAIEHVEPYGPQDRRGPGIPEDLAEILEPTVVDVVAWPSATAAEAQRRLRDMRTVLARFAGEELASRGVVRDGAGSAWASARQARLGAGWRA